MKSTPKSLNKYRIENYSVFALSFLAMAQKGEAQIIYADIIPDTSLYDPADFASGQYNLFYELPDDLDQGHFFFVHDNFIYNDFTDGGSHIYRRKDEFIISLDPGNSVAGSPGPYETEGYVYVLEEGDLIGPDQNWLRYASNSRHMHFYNYNYIHNFGTFSNAFLDGNWFEVIGDKYIGTRFKISGNTYYGWIRVEIEPGTYIPTIKDYAFEASAPLTPITAGDTISDVIPEAILNPSLFEKLFIYENILTVIPSINYNQPIKIKIISMNGAVVFQSEVELKKNSILIPKLSSGLYLASIQINDIITTIKFTQ